MKKLLLITLLSAATFAVQAQSKGTNTVGIGFNSQTIKTQFNAGGSAGINEQRNSAFTLGYGHFIRENQKIGIDLNYGTTESQQAGNEIFHSKLYGGTLRYQRYYPVFKKFYAFGSGKAGYSYNDGDYNSTSQGFKMNSYQVGASGGVAWFLSRRFALESDLLSADIVYSKFEDQNNGSVKSSNSTFNLSSSGAFNGLGFKIFLLF